MQKRRNSRALALELCLYGSNPLIYPPFWAKKYKQQVFYIMIWIKSIIWVIWDTNQEN